VVQPQYICSVKCLTCQDGTVSRILRSKKAILFMVLHWLDNQFWETDCQQWPLAWSQGIRNWRSSAPFVARCFGMNITVSNVTSAKPVFRAIEYSATIDSIVAPKRVAWLKFYTKACQILLRGSPPLTICSRKIPFSAVRFEMFGYFSHKFTCSAQDDLPHSDCFFLESCTWQYCKVVPF
jgi:hypothetical protein